MLEEGLRERIAKEEAIIPNIELKFVKDDFDRSEKIIVHSHQFFHFEVLPWKYHWITLNLEIPRA